jgi:hypothetical protein
MGCPVSDEHAASTFKARQLAPADFFLFPRLKNITKGARFADVAAIQEHVTGSAIDS